MSATAGIPIDEMTPNQLKKYERDLWATYRSLPIALHGTYTEDITRCLRLIGHVQRRRKELRGIGGAW